MGHYEVPGMTLIPQKLTMSCWYASAQMLIQWRQDLAKQSLSWLVPPDLDKQCATIRDGNAGIQNPQIVPMAKRLGLSGQEPHVLLTKDGPHEPSQYVDVHAGKEETSVFGHLFPEILRADVVPTLEPTNYGPDDLAEWRKGWENGRHKTPRGYLGDPAAASTEHGQKLFEDATARMAGAIERQLRESPWLR